MVAVLKQHQNVLKVASQVHLSSILCQGLEMNLKLSVWVDLRQKEHV